MTTRKRGIGPLGTAARVLVGGALLHLALFEEGEFGVGLGQLVYSLADEGEWLAWGLTGPEAALGLLAFPALMVAVGLAARQFGEGPLRLTGPLGIGLNTAAIVGLAANPVTGDAVVLFYGVSLLLAAWRGLPGCEMTVISNWVLGRDDQVGCPVFSPIDAVEQRLSHRGATAAAR